MGNAGKLPHRNDMGKKGADRWEGRRRSQDGLSPASNEQEYDRNLDQLRDEQGVRKHGPQESGGHAEVGGSRPGVESRVKERLDTLEERGEIRERGGAAETED